ncbi:MAG: hypothetical protein HY687_00800 [Chloroflexi bacterium]|nr:hypothetical protein [Chloroflexota bacterium]
MSWFVEKLERITTPRPKPMGFGAAARAVKEPALLLLALLGPKEGLPPALPAGADAVVLRRLPKEKTGQESSQNQPPWGLALESVGAEETAKLQESSCDFVIFGAAGTATALLHDEDIGKILRADPDQPDSHLRVLANMPIDALFLELPSSGSLDMAALVHCQRLAMLAQRPILLHLAQSLQEGDLEGLWNVGVRALAVELATAPQGLWEELRRAIDAFTPAPKKDRERRSAVLPAVGLAPDLEDKEEEEEEDF